MNHSVARVESERASIYLQQLCKHFAHKRPVEFTPERGQISLAAGMCRLEASGGVLTIRAEAEDAEKLIAVAGRDRQASRALCVPQSRHPRLARRGDLGQRLSIVQQEMAGLAAGHSRFESEAVMRAFTGRPSGNRTGSGR